MEKTKIFTKNEKLNPVDFYSKFVFIENFQDIKKLSREIELCIVQTDFTPAEIAAITNLKTEHSNIDFWLCQNVYQKKIFQSPINWALKPLFHPPFRKRQ